ncbi:uncharacterized protein LOC106636331 [Copidosoma floridanum]|uniref:uncharacterized protein LOC106636331 n=1 Tax=Copidosoma floridanum TaxID=29053 RepID=UPI0006C9CB38|nr:uncharacterized protein LOC106636331 [Copidosoma floridanum]
MECPKVIVDCDAGTDDALALAMLISAQKFYRVQILAITCVSGNTHVDNVINNVYRTLEVCGALDIPVYKGADSALLSTDNVKFAKLNAYHGTDGFGDVYQDVPDTSRLKDEHAVNALRSITAQYHGEVTILCLGPLTNIALAIKMYPNFADSVKRFLVMGGNSAGVGNITSQAEFNFFCDPESVHIVIDSTPNKLWLLTWETCLKAKIDMEWRKEIFGKIDTPVVHFVNKIDDGVNSSKNEEHYYIPCDAYVVGVFLRPDAAKDVVMHNIDIELGGLKTRGLILVDHMKFNKPNAYIVQDIDLEIFKDLLLFTADPNTENSRVLL